MKTKEVSNGSNIKYRTVRKYAPGGNYGTEKKSSLGKATEIEARPENMKHYREYNGTNYWKKVREWVLIE